MSFIGCSIDSVRPQEKPATLIWAWYDKDNVRRAYKQILCVSHFVQRVLSMQVAAEDRWANCPACGTDTTQEVDGIYLTLYMPKVGRKDIEFATCARCAPDVRERATEGALELEDRRLGAGIQAPNLSASTVWESLGRQP